MIPERLEEIKHNLKISGLDHPIQYEDCMDLLDHIDDLHTILKNQEQTIADLRGIVAHYQKEPPTSMIFGGAQGSGKLAAAKFNEEIGQELQELTDE